MTRKLKRGIVYSTVVLLVLVSGLLVFAPYRYQEGFSYRLVKHTVRINVPADSVFRFLGNSANAGKWSVFVHHITTLNGDAVPDGQPGSRRRCFCRRDETGTRWDEVLKDVVPGRKRQIICYNLVEFPMGANGLATEQIYTPLGPESCELSFTLFFIDGEPGMEDDFKMRIASYRVKSIFAENMSNIKRILESEIQQRPMVTASATSR